MSRRPALLSADPDAPFPSAADALSDPEGLLAIGGDLSPPRLLNAYRNGIFPWFSEGQPILWWSPDPRMVFDTDCVHLSRRLRRDLRSSTWQVCADTAFDAVLAACAGATRDGQLGTWITAGMAEAYSRLHALGHAHSVEVYDGEDLVGGIYGVAIGRMFYGESMFSRRSGGSKVALAALALRLRQWGWPLLDAQVANDHLVRMGARLMPRREFLAEAGRLAAGEGRVGHWSGEFGSLPVAALAVGTGTVAFASAKGSA